MTKCEEIRSILRTNPTATNEQMAEVIGCEVKFVRDMIARMVKRGDISIESAESQTGEKMRSIKVLIEPKAQRMDYKKEIMTQMCDVYVEDFFAAELFSERAEIGKLILRILERL